MLTFDFLTADVPLNKILAWEGNARLSASDADISELAASIAAHGLLQSLVVKKAPRGKYAVFAGKRRWTALHRLVAQGSIPASHPVPCRIVPTDAKLTDADLLELSLAENVLRVPMHPADEFDAFQRLVSEGQPIADIAARFGVSENVVKRRLSLARVSPLLIAAYREGAMTLELLQAFTITDDHSRQETVWSNLHTWHRNPNAVRQLLSQNDTLIPASDSRVQFVGLNNYEASGGLVTRDLFSEDEQGAYIADPAKLTRLVDERLQRIADELRADGWSWIEVQPERDHDFLSRHRRLPASEATLSPEAQAELDALSLESQNLDSQLEPLDDDEAADPLRLRLDEITDRIDQIETSRFPVFPAEIKAVTGAVVSIDHEGQPHIDYALVRKQDEAAAQRAVAATRGDPPSSPESAARPLEADSSKPLYSAALLESLSTHKSAAIAAELLQQPSIALAAVAHALVLSTFRNELPYYRHRSALQIATTVSYLEPVEESPAGQYLLARKKQWLARFPQQPDQLWTWFLEQSTATLLEILADCASRTLNVIQAKNDDGTIRLLHGTALATSLGVDMSRWFTPTAENYFDRISKARIADTLTEAGKPPDSTKLALKKAQFAKVAEYEVAGTGWLPEPLRIATAPLAEECPIDNPDDDCEQDDFEDTDEGAR